MWQIFPQIHTYSSIFRWKKHEKTLSIDRNDQTTPAEEWRSSPRTPRWWTIHKSLRAFGEKMGEIGPWKPWKPWKPWMMLGFLWHSMDLTLETLDDARFSMAFYGFVSFKVKCQCNFGGLKLGFLQVISWETWELSAGALVVELWWDLTYN